MDTLFSKVNTNVGNTQAQIFTDVEFVQKNPMSYKSEAVTTLDSINREFGVKCEIFMENATKKTG